MANRASPFEGQRGREALLGSEHSGGCRAPHLLRVVKLDLGHQDVLQHHAAAALVLVLHQQLRVLPLLVTACKQGGVGLRQSTRRLSWYCISSVGLKQSMMLQQSCCHSRATCNNLCTAATYPL